MYNTSDSTFFWCEDLCRAGINYNEEQCLQALRKEAMAVKDVDRKFILALTSATASDFTFDHRYFPVYHFQVTARYTKEGKSREVNKSGSYIDPKYADLRPDFFVGGQSSRFIGVNLPRDLEFPLLAANGKGISENEAANRAASIASDAPVRGERRTIDSWSGSVCFVPVLLIKFTYEGKVYASRVNMHNGTCICEAPLENRDLPWATKAARVAGRISTAATLLSLLWIALAGVMIAMPEPAKWVDVGFCAFAVLHFIFRVSHLPKTDVPYWLALRRESVRGAMCKLNKARVALLRSSLLAVVALAVQLVLQFVL